MPNQALSSLEASYARSDKLIFYILIAMQIFSFALAGLHDTWKLALFVGMPLLLIPCYLIYVFPGQIVTRIVNSVALMSYCAAVGPHGSKTVFKELSDATANKNAC